MGHDVNLYAVWVLEEYTVTFLTSGDIVGGNIIGWLGKPILEGDPRLTQTVEYMGHPSTMHKPGDLTHLSNCIHLQANPGYVFAGWNYEVTLPDGTKLTGTFPEEGEIGSITVYGNTMVRAIWEKTYKLTYQPGEHGDWAEDTIFIEGLRGGRDMLVAYYPDLNGPIDNDPSIPALDYGSGIASKRTLPLSKDADFMFDGWVSNDGRYFQTVEEVTKALMSRGDLELTANWVRRPVLVRFDVDGGIPVDDTTALDDRYCTPYEQITLPFIGTVTKPGYHLTGWDYDGHTYKVGTNYSDAFTVPRMGATLKAHWEEDLATLTFKSEATNTTGAGYIVSDFGYKTTHDPGCGSDGKVGAGWCYWHGLSGWYYDDAAGHQVVKVSGFHDEWFNRTTGEVDYVINNAVKPDGKMYQKWYDTLQFNVSAISGQTRGWLSKDSTLVVSDTPIQVRAVARTGYHFLNWVDSNGVVVCDTPEFVAPAGASGVWTNATYYAIFTEDQDIVIKYRVDDPDHGWVSRERESIAPSTGTALGTDVRTLPGYEVVGWYVDDDSEHLIPNLPDPITTFMPPRYGDGLLPGAQIFYDPSKEFAGGHTYTAVIKPLPHIDFVVNHYLQHTDGSMNFDLRLTETLDGPYDTRVGVRSTTVTNTDGTTSVAWHLYELDDAGNIDLSGYYLEKILLDNDYLVDGGWKWAYADDISAQTSHGVIGHGTTGNVMVLDLYYMLDPRNYATIAYEVINVPHVGNDPYGNGDYGSTDPTFELIASGPTGKPLGTKVTVPDGYEFLGWFTSIVDLQGGMAPLSTDLNWAPALDGVALPTTGLNTGDTVTFYAIFREKAPIDIYYDFVPSDGGSISMDHDSFEPVTGHPQAVYTEPKPGYRFSHWTRDDGLWVAYDGTVIAGSDLWTSIPSDANLMGPTFFPQHINNSFMSYDNRVFTAHFVIDDVTFTVERYKVIGGEMVDGKLVGGKVVYVNDDGTLSYTNKPTETVKVYAPANSRVKVFYDAELKDYYVAETDISGVQLDVGVTKYFNMWLGYWYLPDYEKAIESGVVRGDGSLVLRMYYWADPNMHFVVERYTVNSGDPSRPETNLGAVLFDTTHYGAPYNNNGAPTDSTVALQLLANAGDKADAGKIGITAPAGYRYLAHSNEILSAIVKGDGTTVLRMYFEGIEGGTSYKVEHVFVDGMFKETIAEGDPIVIPNATAGTYVSTDPLTFVPAAVGHPGYTYSDTATVWRTNPETGNRELTTVNSNPFELYVAGDGSTVLRLYYVADRRFLDFDLGDEGQWADDFTRVIPIEMATGSETYLPTTGDVKRDGYELVGWYIEATGTNTKGTNSLAVADQLKAMTNGFWGLGSDGHGALFKMPELNAGDKLNPTDPDRSPLLHYNAETGEYDTYVLHAVWRAVQATYTVEVWVQHGNGDIERIPFTFPVPPASDGNVLSGNFGDIIDFSDPTNPVRRYPTANGVVTEALNTPYAPGTPFSVPTPAGYVFEKSFTVPVGANIIGYDTSLPVNGSVNSLELSKTGGSVIYLFYTPEVDKVYYTVNRYMVLSDKVTQIEVDKNGNPIYRDTDGNVYTDAALTNRVADEDLDDYLIRVAATAGQWAHAVKKAVVDGMGLTYTPGSIRVVDPSDNTNYYIIYDNALPGFTFSADLSAFYDNARVAGDCSTVLKLYFDANKQDVVFELGDGSWTINNLNRDDGAFGGTLGRVHTLDTLNLPVNANVERDGYELAGWATTTDMRDWAELNFDYSSLLKPGVNWTVPAAALGPANVDAAGYGVVRLYAVWKPLDNYYNVKVYRVEGGKVIRDKDFERLEIRDANGDVVKPAFMDVNENPLLQGPTGSTVGFAPTGNAAQTIWAYPLRNGYNLITDPTYSTVYGNAKLTGQVTPDGRMTLILYYEAIPGGSPYQVEYWYWDPISKSPVKFDESVAPTVTLHGTAGYKANVSDAAYNTNAPGTLDTTVTGAPDEATPYDSLSYMWKTIEGFDAAPTTSWMYTGASKDLTYDVTYVAADGTVTTISRTFRVSQNTSLSTTSTGTVVGDSEMLVLRLFYTPAPREIVFDPQGGVWSSGTDNFSSSTSRKYMTGQVIDVPVSTQAKNDIYRTGYKLLGWTTDKAALDTWEAIGADRNHATFDALTDVLYTTTYEVGAPLHQTLYAVWEPAEATFNVEHYRVVAIRNADGTISQVLRVEDGPIYTTTQTGFKAEQLIAEGAVREITDYAAYPSLKGFEYFEDFSQLLNGTLYEEFDTITSAPGLAGDGTTTFKLYYVSVLVDYEVQYWKVSGDGVATRVLDEHGEGVSDWRQGYAGAYAKADAQESAPGTWMSYSYVDANGNTVIPTHLTADAFLRDPSIIGYSYQSGTFTINDVSFTSDPYVMIKGDGTAVIRLFYKPDTYKLTLKLNDDVTFTDGNWIKSYSGAGNGFVLTGSIDVTSGSQHYLPGAGAARRPGYKLVGWYTTKNDMATAGAASVLRYNNLMSNPNFYGNGTFYPVGTNYTVPDSDAGTEVFMYAVWVAEESNFQIAYYKVVDGQATLEYVNTNASLKYATGDTVDLRVTDLSDLQARYKLVTNSTFSDNGRDYDFRGYTLDLTDARNVLNAVISGDPTNPTVFRVYYKANDDTLFKVHHVFVDGDGNTFEVLTEIRQFTTDKEWQPAWIGRGTGTAPYQTGYEDNVNHIYGTRDNVNLTTITLSYPLGAMIGNEFIFDFTGYKFHPNSDGYVPGTTLQTSLAARISGDGKSEFTLYYVAEALPLTFVLGDSNSTDLANRDWTSGAASISGNYKVGKTLTVPVSTAATRPGYELVGWYSGADYTIYTTLVGKESIAKCAALAASGAMDQYGVNPLFIPAGGTFKMPQGATTLYAVWRAKEITFSVERWVMEGGTNAKKLTTMEFRGYAGDKVFFDDPSQPECEYYEVQADGSLVALSPRDIMDSTNPNPDRNWEVPLPAGYHLCDPTDPSDQADSTIGGVEYWKKIVTTGTIEEVPGMPIGKPTIYLVYVPDNDTPFYIQHYLVQGDGDIIDLWEESQFRTIGHAKTGAYIDEATGRTYELGTWLDNSTSPATSYAHMIKGYKFGDYELQVLTGTVTAEDPRLVLKLYYLAERQQINFELGTKAGSDYANDAKWRGDNPSTNLYRTGEKIALPNSIVGVRPGYTLYGWYVSNDGAFSTADPTHPDNGTIACDLEGIVSNEFIDTHAGRIIKAGDPFAFEVPNDTVTLYAIWRAIDSEYKVIVKVVNGDGTVETIATYVRTGVTGNYLDYAGTPGSTSLLPTERYGNDISKVYANLQSIVIPAGYRIYSQTSPLLPDGVTEWNTAYLNATGDDADAAGILQTILTVYLEAIPNGTKFYVERYTVDVDANGNLQRPNLIDRNSYNGTAGQYVRVDAAVDTDGTTILNAIYDAVLSAWIANAGAGAEAGWRYLHVNGYYVGFSYDPTFSRVLPENATPSMLYSTNATGRITGHVGDHTSADALVLRLYYVVDQFTITYKSLGGQITEDDGTTPENVDRTVYYNHSYTPLPASQVKKTGYKLKGWTDVASGTVFNIKADGTFDTQTFLWDSNRVFEAIWEALPADVTVVHIKVDRNGNGTIAKTDTFPAIKDAGLTFTVAENGDTMPHDAETYVDRYGNVNTTLVTTDADKLFWLGYGHITSGPHSSVLIGGVLYTTSADGFGYERAVVNADGTTTIYVFYYAGGENDDIKVDYDVNIYKVDGNGNRVLVSSNTYQGYVDTTVHGNANKQGMAEGLAGNDDWHAYDKAMAGYTYRDEGQADAGYYSANAANWFTTAQALLTASLNAAGRPTLNLYYEADEHEFVLHLDTDASKGTYDTNALAAAGWTISTDGRYVSRIYRTEQTTVALPNDLLGNTLFNGAYRHDNNDANPFRDGYELVGWSTKSDGAAASGAQSVTIANNYLANDQENNWLVFNPTTGSQTVSYANGTSYVNTIFTHGLGYYLESVNNPGNVTGGVFSTVFYTEDGNAVVMPASDLHLWAIWKADNNTPYTVERYKIPGTYQNAGDEVQLSTETLYGVTGETVYVDKNWIDAFDPTHAASPNGDSYLAKDTAVAGYTYQRIIASTITLPDGTTVLVPGGGTASTYTGTVASDGSLVLKLYYAPYAVDEHGDPVMHKISYHTGAGKWTGGADVDTDDVRVAYFFTEQNTGALYGDLGRGGYDFVGWTTLKEHLYNGATYEVATAKGYASRFISDAIADVTGGYANSLPGWGTTNGAYYDLSIVPTDLTDGLARLFTKDGGDIIMAAGDIELYAVWRAQNTVPYTVEHYRKDGNGYLKQVIVDPTGTNTLYCVTDEVCTAIDHVYDADTIAKYDAIGKPYILDPAFQGYNVFADGANFTYKDSSNNTITVQNVRTGTYDGVNPLVLKLYYEPRPLKLTFEGGEYAVWDTAPDTDTIDGATSTLTSTHTKELYPVYTEKRFDIGADYWIPKITRTGYTLMGWTTEKTWSLDGGVTSIDISTAKARDTHAIYTDLQMAGKIYMIGDTFTMGLVDTTLYAVWQANVYTLVLTPGGVDGSSPVTLDPNFKGSVQLVTDEQYYLPGSDKLDRDGYDLVGWYYQAQVTLDDGTNQYVHTSEGRTSQDTANKASADTVDGGINVGKHFTRNDPNEFYVMPAPVYPNTVVRLYAVWSAKGDTPFEVHYYKVDGNGNLTLWLSTTTTGIANETYTIANPHDAAQVAAAPYKSALQAIDWSGYKFMGTTPTVYDIIGTASATSDGSLHWAGISGSSITGMGLNPAGTVWGTLTITVAGDGSSVMSVVMDSTPLSLYLKPGTVLDKDGNETIVWTDAAGTKLPDMPQNYKDYVFDETAGTPGVRDANVLTLPGANDLKRDGYKLKGWYYLENVTTADYGTVNVNDSKGLASIAAAAIAMADGGTTNGLVHFIPVGTNFTMPNRDITLYAVWEAESKDPNGNDPVDPPSKSNTYQTIIYTINGDGQREIYKVIDHWGVVDEVASANTYDASKRDYWNDDRPYDNPDDYTKPGLQGYKYIMPGTYVTYYDDFGNPVTTTSVETGYIIGHTAWTNPEWPAPDATTGYREFAPGQQHLRLEIYFEAVTSRLIVDLGVGTWIDGANETRGDSYFPAPGYDNQHSYGKEYKTGATVHLPVDKRYGGLVQAPLDAQGRPYSLQGYAWDNGNTVMVTAPDGSFTFMSIMDCIRNANQVLGGIDNFMYRDALIAENATASTPVYIPADAPAGAEDAIFKMLPQEVTLYAIWAMSVQPLTFRPDGYADINDPSRIDRDGSLYTVYVNPDGTIDETRTTAVATGSWNTSDGNPPAGYEDRTQHNIDSEVTMPDASYLRRVGYNFLGWSRKLGATEPDADLTYQDLDGDGIYETAPTGWRMPAEETILYAVWEAQWIPIIYDSNYPDVPHLDPDEWLVECSTTITLDAPQRDGYKLKGWAVTPDATDIDYKPGDKYDVLNWLSVLEDNGDGTFSEKLVNPNVLYAIWEPDGVELQYWSYTPDSPNDYVLIYTKTVQLTDLFDYKFDQNHDDDPSNDYLEYKSTGWYDEWWVEFYNQDWVDSMGFEPTIQYLADAVAWDGTSPIIVYAELELRTIEVTYVANGYEDENSFEVVQYIPWNVSPYASNLRWVGYTLLSQTDDWGQEVDDTMTCGDVLIGIMEELNDCLTIYIDWEKIVYNVNFHLPNGNVNVFGHEFGGEIQFPEVDMSTMPGYTFVGWYTEPDGAGSLVSNGLKYSDIEAMDSVIERDLYAYVIPIGGSSVSSMSVLDEVVSSIQTASEPAPASSAAPATRSLATAAQVASKPQDVVSAALQLASMQAATPTLADSVQMDAVNGLAADDATLSASLYPAAACAAFTYEMIAESAAGHTVCPAQTMQAVLPSVTRRVA